MKKDEAIKAIQNIWKEENHKTPEKAHALNMAIDSLRSEQHGKWRKYSVDFKFLDEPDTVFICSECNHAFSKKYASDWTYCANCGAKMV